MNSQTPDSDRGRLTAANAGELVEYLASGSAAGLPLDEIFLALAEETDHRGLRRAATRIADKLRRGADMRSALESVGALPPYLRSALAASTNLSKTAAVLAGIAQHETARKRLRRQMRAALLYPAIVLSLLLAVVSGLTVLVLPQFESIYVDFDLDLPELTILVLGVARAIPWLLVGASSSAWRS